MASVVVLTVDGQSHYVVGRGASVVVLTVEGQSH
jgi:hypothetical protein